MSYEKQQEEKQDDGFPYAWKTEQLNDFLGNFKYEYLNAIQAGEHIKIRGKTYNRGRLKLMNQHSAVSLRRNLYPELIIHIGAIEDWNRKELAIHEVQTRKEYAQKMDFSEQEKLIEQKTMSYISEEIDPALIPF